MKKKYFPIAPFWLRLMLCIAIAVAQTAPISPSAAATLDSILDGIEKRYAGTGFRVSFFQESKLKAMQISDTAKGRLTVKHPGKMRWQYTEPEPQTIITDGHVLWIYRPEDNQVMVGKAPTFFADGKGAGFLSDMHQIRSNFTIELQNTQKPDYYRLQLLPAHPTPELAEIVLFVAKKNFQVMQIITLNVHNDETRIVLSDYRFNLDLEDTLFTFNIPKGADIIKIEQP